MYICVCVCVCACACFVRMRMRMCVRVRQTERWNKKKRVIYVMSGGFLSTDNSKKELGIFPDILKKKGLDAADKIWLGAEKHSDRFETAYLTLELSGGNEWLIIEADAKAEHHYVCKTIRKSSKYSLRKMFKVAERKHEEWVEESGNVSETCFRAFHFLLGQIWESWAISGPK